MNLTKYAFLLPAACLLLSGSGRSTAATHRKTSSRPRIPAALTADKAGGTKTAAAWPELPGLPPSPDASPFTDPDFQNYVETAYGYRNPRIAAKLAGGFRDALTSFSLATLISDRPAATSAPEGAGPISGPQPAIKVSTERPAPGRYYKVTFADDVGPISSYVSPLDRTALSGFKTGDYVFITVFPKAGDYQAVIRSLSGSGFKFAGEKTYLTSSGKKTFLLGWAPYSRLEGIYKDPLVRRVAIEKRASGVPFKTRIRFTLRAPGGTRAGVFVSDFIRRLGSDTGFASEHVLRLPNNSAAAKFTAFEVTGSLPVDMVGEISRSPFVAAVEFRDQSI